MRIAGPSGIERRVHEISAAMGYAIEDRDWSFPIEFVELTDSVWADLPALFGGARHVIVLTSVGHGAWESALVNTLDPGDTGLFTVSGRFGERWSERWS